MVWCSGMDLVFGMGICCFDCLVKCFVQVEGGCRLVCQLFQCLLGDVIDIVWFVIDVCQQDGVFEIGYQLLVVFQCLCFVEGWVVELGEGLCLVVEEIVDWCYQFVVIIVGVDCDYVYQVVDVVVLE